MTVNPGQFMLARLDDVARWAQSSSVWPLTMGLACCAIEMMTVTSSEYDIARLGSEVFRSSPRQADLMIVSGRVAQKMGPVIKRLYDHSGRRLRPRLSAHTRRTSLRGQPDPTTDP